MKRRRAPAVMHVSLPPLPLALLLCPISPPRPSFFLECCEGLDWRRVQRAVDCRSPKSGNRSVWAAAIDSLSCRLTYVCKYTPTAKAPLASCFDHSTPAQDSTQTLNSHAIHTTQPHTGPRPLVLPRTNPTPHAPEPLPARRRGGCRGRQREPAASAASPAAPPATIQGRSGPRRCRCRRPRPAAGPGAGPVAAACHAPLPPPARIAMQAPERPAAVVASGVSRPGRAARHRPHALGVRDPSRQARRQVCM